MARFFVISVAKCNQNAVRCAQKDGNEYRVKGKYKSKRMWVIGCR